MKLKLEKPAFLPAIGFATVAISTAAASDLDTGNHIRFELGAGGNLTPIYEGSSDYELRPSVLFRIKSLHLGSLRFGGDDDGGFSVGPSFRYLSERSVGDDAILTGINDVDASLELGVAVSYEWDYARVFFQGRYGVTGHNGFVGEAGAQALWRPSEATKVSFGPQLSFMNGSYANAYFTVPAGAAFLPAYTADGGLKSYGLVANVRHDFSDRWAVEGTVQWDRLAGDAADSPIVAAGSENQFGVKINFIRKFDFDF